MGSGTTPYLLEHVCNTYILTSPKYLAMTETYRISLKSFDMSRIAKLTFCGGDFQNPFVSNDIMP